MFDETDIKKIKSQEMEIPLPNPELITSSRIIDASPSTIPECGSQSRQGIVFSKLARRPIVSRSSLFSFHQRRLKFNYKNHW